MICLCLTYEESLPNISEKEHMNKLRHNFCHLFPSPKGSAHHFDNAVSIKHVPFEGIRAATGCAGHDTVAPSIPPW